MPELDTDLYWILGAFSSEFPPIAVSVDSYQGCSSLLLEPKCRRCFSQFDGPLPMHLWHLCLGFTFRMQEGVAVEEADGKR